MNRYMLHLTNDSKFSRKNAKTILRDSRDLSYGMNLILRDCRVSKRYIELDTSIPENHLDDLIQKLHNSHRRDQKKIL